MVTRHCKHKPSTTSKINANFFRIDCHIVDTLSRENMNVLLVKSLCKMASGHACLVLLYRYYENSDASCFNCIENQLFLPEQMASSHPSVCSFSVANFFIAQNSFFPNFQITQLQPVIISNLNQQYKKYTHRV